MVRYFMFLVLCVVSVTLFADARFVEAPAECHFPYDNGNVGNEYKSQSCAGVIKTHPDGTRASAAVTVEHKSLSGGLFVVDDQDVRDQDAYPDGVLTIRTSGRDSNTQCTIVDAAGTTYQSDTWNAAIQVSRTTDRYDVDVQYRLTCWNGAAQ